MKSIATVILLSLILLWGCGAAAWNLHGFIDGRSGVRLQNDSGQRKAILNELRGQLEVNHDTNLVQWQLRSDFVIDEAAGEHNFDLDGGHGIVDLRDANVLFSPHDLVDIKLGRQILTWGTGDLLFINDLFPKDWQSFFIGRDSEYLKAPSDAIFISIFPELVNIDIVYTPCFDSDRYISGERISFWNPLLNRHSHSSDQLHVATRSQWFVEDELSVRLYQNVGSYELALYGYHGYWKSPVGYNPTNRKQTFPRLRTVGASARGSVGVGLLNVEVGYYDSYDDRSGDDPLIPNSEYRVLIGYEQELWCNFSAAAQYYLEYMDDYSQYQHSMPSGSYTKDRDRHVVTLRLTQQALNQNLTLSLFTFWSPSDQDGYVRPSIKYKASDALSVYVGANLFLGTKEQTFFGQFDQNNNAYIGIRHSF